MDTKNIWIAFDNKYATPARVLVTSVLSNSRDHDQLRIYILDNGIDKTTKTSFGKLTKIKDFDFNFINIDNKQFEHYHLPEYGHFPMSIITE